ncbi:hypothetical protein LZ023_34665 (plasmid) [Pseudomonas silvicola]|nr:hypothetical protein LZ023_34665 [Pseudomonas silvicola]
MKNLACHRLSLLLSTQAVIVIFALSGFALYQLPGEANWRSVMTRLSLTRIDQDSYAATR